MSTHYDQALSVRKQGFTFRAFGAKIGVSKTQVHRWLRNFEWKSVYLCRRR